MSRNPLSNSAASLPAGASMSSCLRLAVVGVVLSVVIDVETSQARGPQRVMLLDHVQPLRFTQQDPPWLNGPNSPRLPAVAQTTPMDALVGLEQSEVERLVDGEPILDDDETILTVLFRIPQIGLDAVERFVAATEEISLNTIVDSPDDHRVSMFRLNGTARRVQRIVIEPEMAERYDFAFYYRVILEVEDPSTGTDPFVWINLRDLPKNWPLDTSISEKVRCDGLFIALVGDDLPIEIDPNNQRDENHDPTDPLLRPMFLANSVDWFPDGRDGPSQDFNPGLLWLAKSGMSAALWEPIGRRDRMSLGMDDSECFYQLLATLKRVDLRETPFKGESRSLNVFDLLQEPDANRGDRFRVVGNVRRVTRVEVSRKYYSGRTGVEYYYQLDLFVPLKDNQIVRMKMDDGSDGPVYRQKYPITICIPELPEGLEVTDDINVQVTVDAHFFKLWAYPSNYVEQFDPDLQQIGPLFVGHQVEVEETSVAPIAITVVAGVILLFSLGGAWLGAMWLGRKDDAKRVSDASEPEDPDWLKNLERDAQSHGVSESPADQGE